MSDKVSYTKHSKEDVHFQHPAKSKDHCGQCIYFEVFGPNKCAIVSGKIESTDWCDEYRKGKKIELG